MTLGSLCHQRSEEPTELTLYEFFVAHRTGGAGGALPARKFGGGQLKGSSRVESNGRGPYTGTAPWTR
jgi:hypothetical protein